MGAINAFPVSVGWTANNIKADVYELQVQGQRLRMQTDTVWVLWMDTYYTDNEKINVTNSESCKARVWLTR